MVKKKVIFNIDGPRGIGKSTQIGLLSRELGDEGIAVGTHYGLCNDAEMLERLNKSVEMLDDKYDIVLNEGCFLRPMAEDFQAGMNQAEVTDRHKHIVALNEKTRHKYKVVTILLYSEDVDGLYHRLIKYSELTGQTIEDVDTKKEADLLQRMVGFEKNMITLNANTKIIPIDIGESILDVKNTLKKEIISSFS